MVKFSLRWNFLFFLTTSTSENVKRKIFQHHLTEDSPTSIVLLSLFFPSQNLSRQPRCKTSHRRQPHGTVQSVKLTALYIAMKLSSAHTVTVAELPNLAQKPNCNHLNFKQESQLRLEFGFALSVFFNAFALEILFKSEDLVGKRPILLKFGQFLHHFVRNRMLSIDYRAK